MNPLVIRNAKADAGLTLVEVLVVVAVVALVAAGAVVVSGNIHEKVRSAKLSQDVGTINRAIRVYEGMGGDFAGVPPHPYYILGALKTTDANVDEATGLSGSSIDQRLQADLMLDASELSSDAPRAVWNVAGRRFDVVNDDVAVGVKVKGFMILENADADALVSDFFGTFIRPRNGRAFQYADTGTWVWDYQDSASMGAPEPTPVTLLPGTPPTPPGAPAGTTPLDPPTFSIPGGSHPLGSYDLSLSLANPNDPLVSEIYYSTHLGSWNLYTGTPIVVQAGFTVSAVAVSTDTALWTDSVVVREEYRTAPIPMVIALTVPASMNYAEAGGLMEAGGVPIVPMAPGMVSLVNAADISLDYQNSQRIQLMWTYDGTNPLSLAALEHVPGGSWPPANLRLGDPFGGGFPGQWVDVALPNWGAQTSLPIQVVALSTNPEILLSSPVISETVAMEKIALRAPGISEAGGMVTLTKSTAFGDMPVGSRIYYTTDGTYPGDNNGEPVAGTLYSGPFVLNTDTHPHCGNFTVTAKIYGPAGLTHWFDASPSATSVFEIPPDPNTPERFAYNYSQSDLTNYSLFAMMKLDAKDSVQLDGNIGFGPDGERKLENLGLTGSYDVDPGSSSSNENVTAFPSGASVSPNTVSLLQVALDALALSAEAAALTPTQTFDKIDETTSVYATATGGINVIAVNEIKLEKERKLFIQGGPNDWFIFNVADKIEIKDGSIVAPGGIPAGHILFNFTGSSDVRFQGDGNVKGTFLGTNAKFHVLDDVQIEGAMIMGKDSIFHKDAVIHGEGNGFAFECTAEGEVVGGATDLRPPDFSVPGGTYPSNEYNLSLSLFDTNEAGAATVLYAVDGGAFSIYSGTPLTVTPGMTVEAYAETTDAGRWNDSAQVSNTYTAGLPQLAVPVIATSAPKFDGTTNLTVTVTITNPNAPTLGSLNYRMIGGSWQPYTGPFVLDGLDYTAEDAIIEARVVAANPTVYSDSDVATETVERLPPTELEKPSVVLTPGIPTDPDGVTVTLGDPNPGGTSEIHFVLVPVPSALGCDIIHGGTPPPGTFTVYTGPIEIDSLTYPDGFAVIAFSKPLNPAYLDSVYAVAYNESDVTGLRGGHFDVDTTGNSKYGAVWANWPGGGSTDKHTHEFDNKFDTVVVDLVNMPGNQISIGDTVGASEKFKIVVVNANLSPYAHLAVNQNPSYSAPYVTSYDNTAFADLPVYSLDGQAGSIKLTKLSVVFDDDAIVNAGLLPSNTGDVKGNTPGKAGEWRNGALTVQVVKVDAGGNPVGGPLDATKSNGDQGVADAVSMLHETAIFWHWPGDSYHEVTNTYVPGDQITIVSELDEHEEPVCEGF